MNYQLMFQTIATLCVTALVPMFFVTIYANIEETDRRRLITVGTILLFIITLITGALAAGLS